MSKSLRTFTLLRRPCVHPHAPVYCCHQTRSRHLLTNQNGLVHIQPVRIRKADFGKRLKRALFQSTCITLLGTGVLWYFDLLEDDEEEDQAKGKEGKTAIPHVRTSEGSESDEKEDEGGEDNEEDAAHIPEEMPEDAIFIPFGWTRQRPTTFYKGSDPEWQSFLEFRGDRDRELAVRNELAGFVSSHFSSLTGFQRGLGTPIKVTRSWLDVVIPEGPPPEYERSGLEIADNYVAWTTRPVSALQKARFQAAIFPLPVAKSFWASYRTTLSFQMARLKQMLGLDEESGNPNSSLPSGMTSLDQLRKSSAKQEAQPPARMDKLPDAKSAGQGSTKETPKQPFPDSSKILSSLLPSVVQIGNDNGAGITAWKRTLAKNWRPPHDFGQRGTLLVTGLVQIEGPKGVCVLDIAGSYHPRESRYTHVTCGIRNFRPRKQHPRGGP